MPTATPTPTPDLPATLQAELSFNRMQAPPVVELSPLDVAEDRDPYLSPAELEYFRGMGPRLWIHTQVWLHLRRIIAVDVADWDPAVFGLELERARELLDSAPERLSYPGEGEMGPVVRSYVESVEKGMTGVAATVARLSEARHILEGGEVGPAERSKLARISRDAEMLLDDFDLAMSSYGCSVCGELFRRAAEE